jgi:hypothetical protein
MFMGGMLVMGTVNTIITKLMDTTEWGGEEFSHPYFQTFTMFNGELICLLLYVLIFKTAHLKEIEDPSFQAKLRNRPTPTGLYKKFAKYLFGLPAALDLCASTLTYIGLILSAPSIYQMLRGLIVVVVAIYRKIFLKKRVFKHQTVGVIIVVIGISIVGVASVMWSASSAKDPVLGIIVLIIGQCFTGGMYAIEEQILENIVIHPMEVVGIEGLCGSIYYIVLLAIMYAIPCNYENFCVNGHVEDFIQAFDQIFTNGLLCLAWFLFMITLAICTWTGISTTKHASSLARSTIDTCRTVLVWVMSIIIGWEQFIWVQLVGFIILIIGTAIYNEVLIIPVFGLRESVEAHRRHLKEQERLLEDLSGITSEKLHS